MDAKIQKIKKQMEDEEEELEKMIPRIDLKENHDSNKDNRNKFEAVGFPPNVKFSIVNKLRNSSIKFIRFSYLLDFLAIEALSRAYIVSLKKTADTLKSLT